MVGQKLCGWRTDACGCVYKFVIKLKNIEVGKKTLLFDFCGWLRDLNFMADLQICVKMFVVDLNFFVDL